MLEDSNGRPDDLQRRRPCGTKRYVLLIVFWDRDQIVLSALSFGEKIDGLSVTTSGPRIAHVRRLEGV